MVGDVVAAQVPLVLHLLLADLAGELPADGVHVEDVLLQVELVTKNSPAIIALSRLTTQPHFSSATQPRNVIFNHF